MDALVDDYVAELCEESPATASFLGIPGHDHRSPDLSAAGFLRRERQDDRWLERLASLADDELDGDERIDRDFLAAELRGRGVMRDWAEWRRSPDTYATGALMGVLTLLTHRTLPEPELVTAVEARLLAMPELLLAGEANLEAELASPLLVRRAVGQCHAAEVYTRDLVAAEVADDKGRSRLTEAGALASEAFVKFRRFLEDLSDRAEGSHAIGAARYTALLRQRELLEDDAHSLRERGREAYDRLDAEMGEVARAIDGADDWRAAVQRLNDDRPADPDEMRAGYEQWTQRARTFVVERELVTLPDDEECRVVPSPTFQRPMLAVASYFPPPVFGTSRTGHFFVPYPPDGTGPDEVAERLANNSFPAMPTISVHEAYPGHHWHFTVLADSRPLRRVHRSTYFVEGWGLYVEKMMREQGFFSDPGQELAHLDFRIFRAARIVVDVGLHTGEMEVDEAVAWMRDHTSLSEPNARAEVARYCAWPTQASSYLTGSLEIERLASAAGDLRAFHDTIAASGGLPIALAERSLALSTG